MSSRSKLLITAAIALVALTATAASATAASFRIEPGGTISSPSVGKLVFTASAWTIECEVTLRGTLSNALLNKEPTTQFGSITGVTINQVSCQGGNVERVLVNERERAWPIRYRSITGTLPEAVSAVNFDIDRTAFQFGVFGGFTRCLYEGNAGASMATTLIREGRYRSGNITVDPASEYRVIRGFGCPENGRMAGTFTITAQTITRL